MKTSFAGLVAAFAFVCPIVAPSLMASPAFAHAFEAEGLKIAHPYIPTPLKSAKTAAGYLAISNTGSTSDKLVAVESDAAEKVQVHTSEVDASGVVRMIHVPDLEIPAGASVALEPGALHLMFLGLKAPLVEGTKIPATLVFEKAGRVAVEFAIDPPKAGADMGAGHEGMAH